MVVAAVASLAPIAVAMATTTAVRQSQAAAAAGNTALALADARAASQIEPGAASPQIQSALVLELRGELNAAVAAAQRATTDESTNWQPWLILSRLQAESGHARAAVSAFRRARSLNPSSPVL
jgi:Flp pilus assembly protein TadD